MLRHNPIFGTANALQNTLLLGLEAKPLEEGSAHVPSLREAAI
jgi:hypothetical protein